MILSHRKGIIIKDGLHGIIEAERSVLHQSFFKVFARK
jgi:hypothetical protein